MYILKNNNILSKKAVTIWKTIAILLFFGSFACLTVGGILGENGYGWFWWPLFGLAGFFVLDILSIVILFTIRNSALFYEEKSKEDKLNKYTMTILNHLSKESISEKLTEIHFKLTEDGYYRKKVFSFSKDSVCYLIRMVNAIDVHKTIESELKRADARNYNSKNTCLILFLHMDLISPDDIKYIRKISNNSIINETIIPTSEFDTCILILVDAQSKTGQFLYMKGFSISIYKHGCKMIKKYFGS